MMEELKVDAIQTKEIILADLDGKEGVSMGIRTDCLVQVDLQTTEECPTSVSKFIEIAPTWDAYPILVDENVRWVGTV